MKTILLVLSLLLPLPSRADEGCSSPSKCVPKQDLDVFGALLREKHCLQTEKPAVELDTVTIIVDRQGRFYYSGNVPKPYKLRVNWCNYTIDAEANVKVQVAQRVEPTWGPRFRVKASAGVLGVLAFTDSFREALDMGILLEPFYVRWANLNLFVGVRSYGAGVGFDITKNFGAYVGYAMTWGDWKSSPFAALSFSLW